MSITWVDNVTPLNAANMGQLEQTARKGQPNGYPGLDSGGSLGVAGSLSTPRVVIRGDGAGGDIIFQGDTNLYRSTAGTLKTDAFLDVQSLFKVAYGRIATRAGGLDEIQIGDRGGDGTTPYIRFGSAGDTNLYRGAASFLKTDGHFVAVHSIGLDENDLGQSAPLAFGSARDVNLYRPAPGVLQTDGNFKAGGYVIANEAGGNNALILHSDGKMYFGGGLDTNLYRAGPNQLKTDGYINASYAIYAQVGAATQIGLVAVSGLYPGIVFGSQGDTVLYRSSADILQTDDEFRVARASTGHGALAVGVSGITWSMLADGTMKWGPGNATYDVTLYRRSPANLRTNGTLWADNSVVIGASASGGKLYFSDASDGLDTNLFRAAANVLRTDDSLEVGGNLTVSGAINGGGGGGGGDAAWTSFTGYGNQYSAGGAPFGPPAFRKLSSGLVVLRGVVNSFEPTPGDYLTSMPAGYRPGINQMWNCRTSTGSARIDVEPGGGMRNDGQVPASGWVSVNEISYYAEG